jgi:hypothetical protein
LTDSDFFVFCGVTARRSPFRHLAFKFIKLLREFYNCFDQIFSCFILLGGWLPAEPPNEYT